MSSDTSEAPWIVGGRGGPLKHQLRQSCNPSLGWQTSFCYAKTIHACVESYSYMHAYIVLGKAPSDKSVREVVLVHIQYPHGQWLTFVSDLDVDQSRVVRVDQPESRSDFTQSPNLDLIQAST